MELNDANLQTLTEFLRKTLDPDPTVRRPGRSSFRWALPWPLKSGDGAKTIIVWSIHLLHSILILLNIKIGAKILSYYLSFFVSLLIFPAEKFLESVEGNPNYSLLLLTLLEKSQDNVIRVCAAVTFKNYIKRNWRIVSRVFYFFFFLLVIMAILWIFTSLTIWLRL